MSEELEYLVGVSWPRSGHHLLVRLLSTYFGNRFGYCEYYTPDDCCKSVPCRRDTINLSKNHDNNSIVPILNDTKYIIQYRKFCSSVVSNFELFVRRTGKNDADNFKRFAEKEAKKYIRFMKRWSLAKANNSTFVRISYERLVNSTEETLESVVKLFRPGQDSDRVRLAHAIQAAERVTVKDGVETVDPERGVLSTRDVRSFRFYDEKLFRILEQQTKAAYDEMAERPLIAGDFDPTKPREAPFVAKTNRAKNANDLYVDATGMLAIAGVAPTGIPRVQNFLIRHAIEDPDPHVHVVLYDRRIRHFRYPDSREIRNLVTTRYRAERKSETPGKQHLFRDVLRQARENPWVGKEFDRHSAQQITKSHAEGMNYSFVKNSIRAYRYYRRVFELKSWLFKSASRKSDPRNGILLMSHMLVTGSLFSDGILATERRAFVCHDLIPWLHPEFVNDRGRAQRIVSQLKLLLEAGAHVLCTSNASRAMLDRFVAEAGNVRIRIGQFPLPSILHETAKSLGRTSRFEPAHPFVLYCSTVEARKNHLLLIKIWKKARDQGIALPKLVCVGKWGWGVQELHNYMDAHPEVSQCVEFLGPVDDVELIDLYRSALFGVMPSYVEGWGYPASECLDFGLPVIVSTAPALREATRDLMPILDPNDEAAWLAQIRRLAANGPELEALRRMIADRHRPMKSSVSWDAIKAALGTAS